MSNPAATPGFPPPQIQRKAGSSFPPGPTLIERALAGDLFRLNPLPFIDRIARQHGDLVHMRAAGRDVLQCNHPELIGEMLITHSRFHHRGLVMQKAQFVLGKGLLSSEDPHHMRQRRLAQPAFHRDRIAGYGRIIGNYAREAIAGWRNDSVFDLAGDMQRLTLRIVGKTMFNNDMESENKRIAGSIDAFMAFLPLAFLPRTDLIVQLPIPMMNRIRQSRQELDTLIYGLIRERRADAEDRGDLLSMLMATQDEEEGTGAMTDEQVRDECVTALLAGNETTANGLSFALWLIASHPAMQERLQTEAQDVLGTRSATAEDYPKLPLAHACFAEAMRLYPPVWTIARTAAERYEWRGFDVPVGTLLLAPQWFAHRDPRFHGEPEAFRPDRFLNGEREAQPRFSYFPFGAGNRQCIGEGLAWMEGVLILATIAREWTLLPEGPGEAIPLDPKVTLRPKHGVRLRIRRHSTA